MWKKIAVRALIIFLVIISFLIGRVEKDWPLFTIKYEIDVVNLFIGLGTIGVTLGIAYWVSSVIEKSRDLSRNERDLALSKINDLIKHTDSFISLFSANTIANLTINSSLKNAFMLNDSVLDLVTKSTSIETDNSFHVSIFDHLKDLRVLLTQYPANPELPAGTPEPVIFHNDNYIYTTNRLAEIESVLNLVKEVLTSYSLFIIQS